MKLNRALFLSVIMGLAAGVRAAESYTNAYEAIALFTQVLEEVHRNYVNTNEAGYDSLIRHALTGMLQDLDPYSQFMDEESFEDLKEDTAGRFSGIGLEISTKEGLLTVVSPMEDTPAFRAGFLPGDIILEIDGNETRKMGLSEAVKKMRGEAGTTVKLKSIRPATHEIKENVLTRQEIEVASVKEAKLLEGGIGYIRVIQFNEPTAGDLKKELSRLVGQKMKALVLDLRGNPGGLLTTAAGVAELFLPHGALIVFTKGRSAGMDQQTFKSTGLTHYTDFPMVILINEGSASASEIVSGALQDHKRAVLVGEKTFGKGCVQSVLPLEDGAAIKLTTAYYYTPGERIIQDHGIEPDIKVEMAPEDLFKLRTKQTKAGLEEGEMLPAEAGVRDIQLDYAIGTLKGMMIQQERMK
ncbi:MAG: S41 family peptidase [Pontiellaceae bacterium]|jgi:carboxyl-terminal processing protease|nr:S41 family peptidase [Pontiellaceae bacterium]